MKFEEIIEEVTLEEDDFDIDAWHKYWMKITDPRYIKDKEDFNFEQASGSGEWNY